MTAQNLSICIPAFNEENSILNTVQHLRESFPNAEIIVVNDCSTDKTLEIIRQLPGIIIINHERNTGYGGSLKSAMRLSTRDIVVWYDADGQHHPSDLQKVALPVVNGEKDVIIGVRDRNSDVTLNRLPGKFLIKIVAEMIVRQPIPDINSGLRCFRKDAIRKYLHLLPDGFSASTTSTLLMMKRGYRIGYVPITTTKRIGKSTVKIFRDGWETIKLMIRILILFDAFNFFTSLAILQIVPSLVYGFTVAATAHLGFPTLAATVLISGVLTFFMGIICDQVVTLRQEKLED